MVNPVVSSLKVLPILVCKEEIINEQDFLGRIEELRGNLSVEVQILNGVIINEESHLALLEEPIKEADVILLYKPY